MKGSADLYLDDEHLDKNKEMVVNPKKVLLSKYEVSEDIKSIEVFAAGAFKIKISIMINGDIVFADKLSLVDRFANIFFSKKWYELHTKFFLMPSHEVPQTFSYWVMIKPI